MADSLTTLVSKIQAFHDDDGTIFTTALITAAVRAALKTFYLYAPIHAGTLITGVNDQYEYELSDEDSRAILITDVLLQDDDNAEYDISLQSDAFNEDERVFFRLRYPVTTSNTLKFATPSHTPSTDWTAKPNPRSPPGRIPFSLPAPPPKP